MITPHVHVPYERIQDYVDYLREHRVNLEVYFSSHVLDTTRKKDIEDRMQSLGYSPEISIHGPFMDLSPGAVDEKVRAVSVDRFLRTLDLAETLRPKVIVFHSGYEKWKYAMNITLWLEKSLKTWYPLIKKAENTGTRIAIENIFEEDPENLRLLMEEAGSERFGICFDTGHCNLFSRIPLDGWLDQLQEYIIEMHLHDNWNTSDEHLGIGEGSFDFDLLFRRMKGRNPLLTIEGHTPEEVLKSLKRLQQAQAV
jgi:sugar phosphate isomerase/epimerase